MLNGLADGLLRFLFPPSCVLCRELVSHHQIQLCPGCYADLQQNQLACLHCAIPLPSDVSSACCADCLQRSPPYDHSQSALIYAQPLEWMIHQFKFKAQLFYAPLFASLMYEFLQPRIRQSELPDAIIPMPLHPSRLKQRGFNQSYLLAKPLADAFAVPLNNDDCRRLKNTSHQTGKTAKQRRQNIKGAFQFENKKAYRHLVIVDDVVTTGSSVAELARELKRQGVERVDVWSLARAEKVD